MTVGGDYDSPEKAFVRTKLWDPAFTDLIGKEGVPADKLVILELPGAKCVYLKHLVERFGVSKTNMVAAEQFEEPFLAIHDYLEGSGAVFRGLVEDICEDGHLASYFPVDVANLDFCGQGFIFPDLAKKDPAQVQYQRRWDCIKYVMEENRKREKNAWYLLLTLSCNRLQPSGRTYLQKQLAELKTVTGIDKASAGWRDNRLIQEVVPKIVAEEALYHGYIPAAGQFDSYRYRQEKHTYDMVAWRFRLDLDTSKKLGEKISRRKQLLDAFCATYFAADAKELEV